MKAHAILTAALLAAISVAAPGFAAPAAAQAEGSTTARAHKAITCTTYRTSDGKNIGVACDGGRYYVVGTACSAGGCTTIGGPIVNAPDTSWANAATGYFGGDIRAVFV